MQPSEETKKYLKDVEDELYQSIKNRKKLESWMLFSGCQLTSVSLALWLFQLSAEIVAIYAFSSFIALLPGLLDLTGNIAISSRREWQVTTPATSIAKLVVGGSTALISNYQIWSRVQVTKSGIDHTYKVIRKTNPYLDIFNSTIPLLVIVAIFSGLFLWRKR